MDTLDKGVETATSTIGGGIESMTLMRKVMGLAKSKMSSNKESGKEGEGEGEGEAEGGDSVDVEGNLNALKEGGSDEGTIAEMPEDPGAGSGGAFSSSTTTSTPLQPSTTDLPDGGGTIQNSEPSGSGEGDIEMQTFKSNADDSGGGGGGGGDTPAIDSTGNEVSTGAEEAGTDVAEDVGTDVADTVGTDVAEAVGEGAVEAGLETAGAAVDASLGWTGIGAIVGIVMQLAGVGVGIGEAVADSSDTSQEDSLKNQQTGLEQQADEAKSAISKQIFAGGNIMPGLSSTAANAVTSTSF